MDRADLKSEAREMFARQLRQMRIARGFKTARSLAKALNIDENRYTRYERAEVEPDLSLLQQICRLLNATPNELLLGAGAASEQASTQLRAAGASGSNGSASGPAQRVGHAVLVEALAWRLASAAVMAGTSVHMPRDGSSTARPNGEAGPTEASNTGVKKLRETTTLYRQILSQPVATMSSIAADGALAKADQHIAHQIHDLCAKLADALSGDHARPMGR